MTVWRYPHPELFATQEGVGPGKQAVIRFKPSPRFRIKGVCALNSSGTWWSVVSITVGGVEQLAITGRVQLGLLRNGLILNRPMPADEIVFRLLNETDQVRGLELMLCGDYLE